MAQLAEHVLGKDEVTSSNLVSSSKQKSTARAVLFCLEMKRTCGAWKMKQGFALWSVPSAHGELQVRFASCECSECFISRSDASLNPQSPWFSRAFRVFRGKKHYPFTIAPFLESYWLEPAILWKPLEKIVTCDIISVEGDGIVEKFVLSLFLPMIAVFIFEW